MAVTEPPDDPFDGLDLDDAWIAGAQHLEGTADERTAQAASERRALDEEEEQASRAWRARRRRHRRIRALVLVGLLLFSVAVAFADRRHPQPVAWSTASGEPTALVLGGRPTAAPAASPSPLGTPADPDATGGTFAFAATQADGATPVTYDPCRPIEIVVNDTEAPTGARKLVEQAVDRVATITGLALTVTGTTDEPSSSSRAAFQRSRYGDRWAPVLLAWTDPGEVPALGGGVAGLGGSVPVTDDAGHLTYVSGLVLIDAPQAQQILDDQPDGEQIVEDIVLHELGHLVGLDHVGSTAELMYPESTGDVHGYQRGDRTGLTALGQGTCVPLL